MLVWYVGILYLCTRRETCSQDERAAVRKADGRMKNYLKQLTTMQILINIVGLRYYVLAEGRWQRLFTDDGGITNGVSGTSLVLRRSSEHAIGSAVEALSGGERWGNVADAEKEIVEDYLQSRGLEQITTTVVSGDRSMHGLQVLADIEPASSVPARKEFTSYKQWMESAEAFPTLMPTHDEQLLEASLASLEAQVDDGRWSPELFDQLRALMYIDISGDAAVSINRLARKLRSRGNGAMKAAAHQLECDVVHMGSAENRAAWMSYWLSQASSPQMSVMKAVASHADMSRLEPLLLSFPDDVFALLEADAGLAVARLHYARLPREVVRKFVSLWLLWHDRQQPDESEADAAVPIRPGQMTSQQVAILGYYLLDSQKTLDITSRQSLAAFLSLLTGYKERTILRRLDFQKRFDEPHVRHDMAFVAQSVRALLPSLYQRMTREMEAG